MKQAIEYRLNVNLEKIAEAVENTRVASRHCTATSNSRKFINGSTQRNKTTIEQIYNATKLELSIYEDSVKVLNVLTPTTYWIFNITDKDQLNIIIKDRKAIVALYKRKVRQIERRMKTFDLYFKSIMGK